MIKNKCIKVLITIAVLMQVQIQSAKSIKSKDNNKTQDVAISQDATITIPAGKKIASMTVQFGEEGKNSFLDESISEDGLDNMNEFLKSGETLYFTLSSEPSYVKYKVLNVTGKVVTHGIIENGKKNILLDFTIVRPQFGGTTIKYQLIDENKKVKQKALRNQKVFTSKFIREYNTLSIVPGKK